ncbi:GIY-YIG nuclease family protein [Streptomyces umbrinus]|uniref:GIY-YIG nuclease family protein n=1 Tax=Streptomyces umbrinus TaxID=67370 RepID=UPI0035931E99
MTRSRALFLYAISSAEQPAPVKIGKTVDVAKRLQQLQTASPLPLQVWWSRETTDPTLEAKLHRHFADCRMSGEWFRLEGSDWPTRVAEIAEFLEEPHDGPLDRPSRRRTRQETAITVTHGHRPPSGLPEYSREGAGTGDRCLCGHSVALHVGSSPYACISTNTGWAACDPCECSSFRSTVPWSLAAWLAYAQDCLQCQAALGSSQSGRARLG